MLSYFKMPKVKQGRTL